MPRFANRQDSNCRGIVDSLREIPGCKVWPLGGATIDLCVGFRGKNYLIEIKTPKTKKNLKPSQVKFIQEWTGQVNICTSFEDALIIIGASK